MRLSGPVAVEFLAARMALVTALWSNGWKWGSSLWRLCRLRIIKRDWGSLLCVVVLVNCLVKRLAIAACFVQVLEVPSGDLKVMGWLGGGRVFLPVIAPIKVQKPLRLVRGETD